MNLLLANLFAALVDVKRTLLLVIFLVVAFIFCVTPFSIWKKISYKKRIENKGIQSRVSNKEKNAGSCCFKM